MNEPQLRGDVMRPSALGPSEIDIWHRMLVQSASLQRAFFTPAFALACERATDRAYVAVLHSGGTVRGFLPFQFRSSWHQHIRLAERIGGNLSDSAGLIAWPDFRSEPGTLLRLAGLASLFVTHLVVGQERFGFDADWSQVGHLTELREGPDAYFAALLARDRLLVRDTERRFRKAEKTYGPLRFTITDRIPAAMIAALIAAKREQYRRTQVPDAFTKRGHMQLIMAMNDAPMPECRLVMSRLEGGGRVLAQHLGPQHHDVLSHWLPVYDVEARSVSPGRLLLWHMIQRATEDGIALIDYGEGDAVYKRDLSTAPTRYGRANWSSGTVRSLVARAWQSAEWRLAARSRNVHKPSMEQN